MSTLNRPMYVSITGLQVKGFLKFLLFIRHAVMSKTQAERAPGILHVGVKTINGVQHTLTAWESKKHMQAYIYSGHHAKAIKAFRKIATGKTFGFEATTLPEWNEVHELWLRNGVHY